MADLDKAIALLPPGRTQAQAYYNRGLAYEALGNYPAALTDLNRTIELAPEFIPANTAGDRCKREHLLPGTVPTGRDYLNHIRHSQLNNIVNEHGPTLPIMIL